MLHIGQFVLPENRYQKKKKRNFGSIIFFVLRQLVIISPGTLPLPSKKKKTKGIMLTAEAILFTDKNL